MLMVTLQALTTSGAGAGDRAPSLPTTNLAVAVHEAALAVGESVNDFKSAQRSALNE
jgi:hypothetical protein